ncbi:hypothetical protein [Treponema sp. OMZ 857]|jgi:hypothetical protein|uniref:hypothetical protein n=1 Tax=Treponema sp. OMZ 857 TaxID=1643513 RepID=UPI0020A51725|nr:hypothetical protein [Treponema sp. OMZ 857]UTC42914.1 hypothetical protein E4N66_01595 [Treponema sp. OMZ 857]
MNWLFDDKKTTMVITTKRIINKLAPISIVTHDRDDGMWQFLDKGELTEEIAAIVSLEEIILLDESLMTLYDLPLGWIAEKHSDGSWVRMELL